MAIVIKAGGVRRSFREGGATVALYVGILLAGFGGATRGVPGLEPVPIGGKLEGRELQLLGKDWGLTLSFLVLLVLAVGGCRWLHREKYRTAAAERTGLSGGMRLPRFCRSGLPVVGGHYLRCNSLRPTGWRAP